MSVKHMKSTQTKRVCVVHLKVTYYCRKLFSFRHETEHDFMCKLNSNYGERKSVNEPVEREDE